MPANSLSQNEMVLFFVNLLIVKATSSLPPTDFKINQVPCKILQQRFSLVAWFTTQNAYISPSIKFSTDKSHFCNNASALCKFSTAVLMSSYCKALAAKRQYFWAFSLSSGDKLDRGAAVDGVVGGIAGWTGVTAEHGCALGSVGAAGKLVWSEG